LVAKVSQAKKSETLKPPIEQKNGALDEKEVAAFKSED
jgi:hypothetical protein